MKSFLFPWELFPLAEETGGSGLQADAEHLHVLGRIGIFFRILESREA